MHQDDKWGFKLAKEKGFWESSGVEVPQAHISHIESLLADEDRRELLFRGYGPTNGDIPEHLLKRFHEEMFGFSFGETFAANWSDWFWEKTGSMPKRESEIVVITAYDVAAAAEYTFSGRRPSSVPAFMPSTSFGKDGLNFIVAEFDIMRGMMKHSPSRKAFNGSPTLGEFVYAVLPEYQRIIRDIDNR